MSKGVFYRGVAVIVLGLTLLNTVLILVGKHENTHRARETRALAVVNCYGIGALARIERAFINRQERQTQSLLESGITFGIPKSQLPHLIDASKKSQATFLRELDALTTRTCAAPASRRKRKHASTAATVVALVRVRSAVATIATTRASGPTSRRLSSRTLPIPHSTPTRTTTTPAIARSPRFPASVSPRLPPATGTVPARPTPPTTSTAPPATTQPATPTSPQPPPVLPPVPCIKVPAVHLC